MDLYIGFDVSVASSAMCGLSEKGIRRLCPKGLWSPSYFAASCGGAPLDIIKDYVRSQRAPAAENGPYRSPT